MKTNKYTKVAFLFVAVTTLLSVDTMAENKICDGVAPTNCKEIKKTRNGVEVTCTQCDIVACRDNGSGPIAGPGTQTSCPAEPTGFRRITDDYSSYDITTEMAPDIEDPGQADEDTITAPNNFTSALVVTSVGACGTAGASTCDSHGASCDVIHDRGGNIKEVCRWTSRSSESACKRTAGIWTSKSSKYARNHPDAIKSDNKGACITEVKNLFGKKAPQRNDRRTSENRSDHRKPGNRKGHSDTALEAPSGLSALDVTSTSVTLVWTDNSVDEYGVELYRMDPVAARRDKEGGWGFAGLFEERIMSNVEGTGLRMDEDFDLTPDTRYCYRMRAYSGFDRSIVSGYSDSVCTKTLTAVGAQDGS